MWKRGRKYDLLLNRITSLQIKRPAAREGIKVTGKIKTTDKDVGRQHTREEKMIPL